MEAFERFEVFFVTAETPGLRQNYQRIINNYLESRNYEVVDEVTALSRADYFLCIGWRKLLDTGKTLQPVFVVHDSLLPELRGWNPLVSAVELHLENTGVSLFLADGGTDTGPIIHQQRFALGRGKTIAQALEMAAEGIANILPKFYEELHDESYRLQVQNIADATISPWRDEQDYEIDWTQDALSIQQFVLSRGWPYAGARTTLAGQTVIVTGAEVIGGLPPLALPGPGKIMSKSDGKIRVACGEGFVEILGLTNLDRRSVDLRTLQLRTRFGG